MEGTSMQVGRGGLGLWVCVPLLALAVVLMAIADLHGAECGESGPEDSGEVVLLAATALASLGTVAVAIWRLLALWRQGRWALSRGLTVVGLGAVLLAGAIAAVDLRYLPSLLAAVCLAGLLLTAIALLALLVAWAKGRSVEAAGLALPLYLLGMGLLCYPAITFLALVVNSGALC